MILSKKYGVAGPLLYMLFIRSISFGLRLESKDVRNIPSIDELVSVVHLVYEVVILQWIFSSCFYMLHWKIHCIPSIQP